MPFKNANRHLALICAVPLSLASVTASHAIDFEKLRIITNPAVLRAMDACQQDVKTLCDGVPRGGGRVLQCLTSDPASLSKPCNHGLIIALGAIVAMKAAEAK